MVPAQETPAPDIRIEQKLDAQVPLETPFRDEEGRIRPLGEITGGRPTILVLAWYRCPKLCSVVLSELLRGLKEVPYSAGQEFNVVAVSIDPQEGAELAAAKRQAHVEDYNRAGARDGWRFLTGAEPDIQRLADAVGFHYRYDPDKAEYVHASGIMMLTPDGKISRYFYGISYPPRDLRFGLEDASAGKIGSPVMQPLRMLCFEYDPAKGKYTFAILRLVRLAGVLTLVVLAAGLATLIIRDRRRARAVAAKEV
jgi:protein SCO1/2